MGWKVTDSGGTVYIEMQPSNGYPRAFGLQALGTLNDFLDLLDANGNTCIRIDDSGAKTLRNGLSCYKQTPTTKTNDDTPAEDAGVKIELPEGAFRFRVFIPILIEDIGHGIQVAMTGTVGLDDLTIATTLHDMTGGICLPLGIVHNLDSPVGSTAIDAGEHWLTMEGTIKVSSAGTFALSWAQALSDADDTTVEAGAYIEAFGLPL